MKFETINKNNRKYIIVGIILFCILGSVIVFKTTRAKYRTTQSINIVNGTITYKPYDLKVLAMYKQKEGSSCTEDSCYEEITGRMPSSGYVINESKSYCTLDGINKDTEAALKTINGEHVIRNLKKNEKCKLYFDKQVIRNSQELLASLTKAIRPNFGTFKDNTTGTIYIAADDDGPTYYFAGNVTNNWVKFAGFYWRIIRINGDGTIRLIYSGVASGDTVAAANKTGVTTQISNDGGTTTGYAFNSSFDRSEYVGYMYTTNNVHGLGTSSPIKQTIDNWYNTNLNKPEYKDHIDTNAGFCGDRDNYTNRAGTTSGGGTGTTKTYYGAFTRFIDSSWDGKTNPTPTFKCKNVSDLYTISGAKKTDGTTAKGNQALTYPVGLISADEVNYAGAVYGIENDQYYLYTGQHYWTMSPCSATDANVFYVHSMGHLRDGYMAWISGVRPVINLKVDTVFAEGGKGTETEPYVVV